MPAAGKKHEQERTAMSLEVAGAVRPVGARRWGPRCILEVKVSRGSSRPAATISATVLTESSIFVPHSFITSSHSGKPAKADMHILSVTPAVDHTSRAMAEVSLCTGTLSRMTTTYEEQSHYLNSK
jgi:hypothetical protein